MDAPKPKPPFSPANPAQPVSHVPAPAVPVTPVPAPAPVSNHESTLHDAIKAAMSELHSIAEGLAKHRDKPVVDASGAITQSVNKLQAALTVRTAHYRVPTVTSISPPSGEPGEIITITGTGFGDSPDGCVISIGGSPASPATWSDNLITVHVPEGLKVAVKHPVIVSTPAGKSAGTVFTVE